MAEKRTSPVGEVSKLVIFPRRENLKPLWNSWLDSICSQLSKLETLQSPKSESRMLGVDNLAEERVDSW
jgi:hypothetical protein